MELADLAKLVRVADPQLSPNARSVAVLVSRPNYELNRYDTELVLIDVATGAQRVLVTGRRGLAAPRWSPTGDRLAFLAQRQVFVLSITGGEARQITQAPSGVLQFAWRPDGGEIAIATPDESEPRSGEERHNDSFEVGNDDYLTGAPPRPAHLWLVPVANPDSSPAFRRLTSGAWSVATSLSVSPLSWSPDGRAIAFVRFPSPHSGDTDQGTVQVLDVATGSFRALTARSAREGGPVWSPDGARIALSYPLDGDPANLDEVLVAPATGGEGERVTRGLDRHITEAVWLPDGRSLLVAGNDGTRGAAWIQPLAGGGPARRLALGDVAGASGFTVAASGALVFLGTEARRPPEVYHLAASGSAPRRLTDFNREVAALALGRTEPIEWPGGADGLRGNGVLTFPPAFAPGRRYPLVLLIHGGPTATSTEEFSSRAQLFAARGWVVFQPNYRGSDNLGNAYQRAIAAGAADGPGRDVMAGLAAVKRRGFVDTTRIAVSGWSYGGFLTAWLIGRYPTEWRAAVAGAAPLEVLDMYNLSDLNVMPRHFITGSPWTGGAERLLAWMRESPIAHLPAIRTPTLILSNTGDSRVAVTGSYMLYHALRDNGVPVQFIAYPGPGHAPADPVRQRDVQRRWIDWLARYFQP